MTSCSGSCACSITTRSLLSSRRGSGLRLPDSPPRHGSHRCALSAALWLARVKHFILLRLGTEVSPYRSENADWKRTYHILLGEIVWSSHDVVVQLPGPQFVTIHVGTGLDRKKNKSARLSDVDMSLDMRKPKRRPVLILELDDEQDKIAKFKVRRGSLDSKPALRDALYQACKWSQGRDLVSAIIGDHRFQVSKEDVNLIMDAAWKAGDGEVLATLLADPRFSER